MEQLYGPNIIPPDEWPGFATISSAGPGMTCGTSYD
jgi:hypothetical protein